MFNIINLLKLFAAVSIYSFNVKTVNGTVISLNSFKGKKILIVNTASASKYASQIASLEHLRQQHQDSVIILAFPSNDFGHEPDGDSTVGQLIKSKYSIGYYLCSKISVRGQNISPLYKWLGNAALNGAITNPANEDFFKYLIDENGNIRGVFAGSVDPMDSVVQNAINVNYN